MQETAMSRRSFLEATTVVGLAAAVGGSFLAGLTEQPNTAFAVEENETKVMKTLCKGCVGDCGVLAHVRNGRVVKLEGDPDQIYSQGRMCAKGLSFIQALYNPNRIKYPLKRVGARGENKWERITWDEALTSIAEQLIEYDKKYGPDCLMIGNGGGGHTYYSDWCQRFAHVYGAPNVFEPGGLQCYEPRVVANWMLWGGQPSDIVNEGWPEMCLKGSTDMKAMVLWGTNPAASSIGQVAQHVAEARAQGVKTVVIDPRFTPDASKADVWLPIRPQTDLALALCWIKYILDNELYDREAVMKWSNLPFLVNLETKKCLRPEEVGLEGDELAYVVWDKKTNSAQPLPYYPWNDQLDIALDDGPHIINDIECRTAFQLLKERCAEWTIEKAAETCWLEADMIEEAIHIYVDNLPGAVCVGMAADHTRLSTQMGMAQMILQSLMGNFCKSGTIMQQFGAGQFTATQPYTGYVGRLNHFITKEQYLKRFGAAEYKGGLYNEWSHNYTLQNAMLTGEPYQPRIYIERSTNKMMNMPNTVRWEEALSKLDLIVHVVMYPTSFSMYADILLPETEWLETYWTITCGNRVYVRQPVTHLWEATCEPVFWSNLSKKMADLGHKRFQDSFDPAKTAVTEENVYPGFNMDSISPAQIPWYDSAEEWLTTNFAANGGDMTWEELVEAVEENGWYEYADEDEFLAFEQYKAIDEETGMPIGFDTPSKKLEMYGEQLIEFGRTGFPLACYELPPAPVDYDPLPYYLEPEEGPLNPDFSEYPLVITGGHVNMYTHATLRNVPWLRERFPVPQFLINPVDAEKYGIEDGDWVWIESKRGKTQGKATVSTMVAPGVTHMERWWFPETLGTETQGWKEMSINVLTDDAGPFNDIIGSCTYRGFMIKVSKADNPPAGIWLEPEEFEPWLPNYAEAEVTDYHELMKEIFNG